MAANKAKAGKPNGVKVRILEKEYTVACPPEEHDALLASARRLDEKMQEIRASRSVVGLEKVAVMAALNLTHELLLEEAQKDAFARSVGSRVQSLNMLIDSTLKEVD